jgi:peptide deformylase
MALREIVTLPDPILRRKAKPVREFGPELQQIIEDMIETMHQAPGVGLAAPQIGLSDRLIVVEYPVDDAQEDSPKKLYIVVNPELKKISEETEVATEGCLSIPGMMGDVERALAVTVVGRTRRGQPVKIKAEGWLARIFQHEIDHLDGVVYTDRASKVWRPAPGEDVIDNV